MNVFLTQTYNRLISELDLTYQRFLFEKINPFKDRLLGIIGPRGVGKTTLMLQYIKQNLYDAGGAFYFSADNTYFNDVSILSFVNELYQSQNIQTFFIDEIHKYANWNQELKNLYDSFPKIRIVFSGSSSIDLIKGAYDLSRRAKLLQLPGLSFREYLNIKTNNSFPAVDLDELLQNHQQLSNQLSKISTIMLHFEEYLLFGYYPIVFQGKDNVYTALTQVIDKTIYDDIANFYNLKTQNLQQFKRIINFLASIPPGKVKTNNIAQHLQIDNKTVSHYIEIMQNTGLIQLLYPDAHGNQTLSKPQKIYLDNTTLLAAANTYLSQDLEIGTKRELAFLQFLRGANIQTFFPDTGDFKIGDRLFEVGGKNKTWSQLKNHQGNKYLVKDNMVVGFKHEIPLYLFGFLY